jgi:hypothetical protein
LTGSNTTGSSQGSSVDGDAETMELKGRGGAGSGATAQGNGTRGPAGGQEGPTIRPGLGRTGFGFKGVKRLGEGPPFQ